MKKINKLILHLLLMLFLYSCGGGMSDAGKVLRNEKIRATDEFLIKKKQPLTLPPDYKTLPKPKSLKTSNDNNENKISEIFKISEDGQSSKKKSSTLEQSIINQLGK